MKAESDKRDDWSDLQAAWQAQPTTAPDLAGLQREVGRRVRRMRVLGVANLLVAGIALGNCVRALRLHDRVPLPVPLVIALMLVVAGYTGWALWQRRRQWRAVALAPHALVAFEHARTQTTLRIWRVSTWLGLAVWLALSLNALYVMQYGAARQPPYTWAIVIGLNALVVLVCATLGGFLGRRLRRRLLRLQAMQRELQES